MRALIEPPTEKRFSFRLIQNGKPQDILPHQAKKCIQEAFASGGVSWKGNPLIPDLFAPYSLKLIAERQEGNVQLTAHLMRKGKATPLSECAALFFSATPIIILPPFLSYIESDLDLRVLARLFPEPLSVTEREWMRLKEEIEGDVELEELGSAKPVEIWPILRLTDRMGAFANLFFAYGEEAEVGIHDTVKPVGGIARRNSDELGWERDLLETGFTIKERGDSRYFCPMDRVSKSLTFLLELGWKLYDSAGRRIVRQKELQLDASASDGRVLLRGALKFDEHEMDLSGIVGAFNRRERFLNLSQNCVGLLDYEKLSLPTEMIVDREGIKIPRYCIGEVKELLSLECQKELEALTEVQLCEPSSRFLGKLYPYQQEGVNFLSYLYANQFGGILADDMGLGKSVQVLAFLSQLSLESPVLIVAPTSLLFNWRKEIERFLPGVPVTVHSGPERGDRLSGVVLTSYALIRQDQVLLSQIEWNAIIFDEAQAFKNPESQLFKAIQTLKARCRISLSGTPIENRPDDIWSQYAILMPMLFKDRAAFSIQLSASSADPYYKRQLQKKMAPFFLRREKSEVLKDLPEKIEQVVWVEMDEEQRECYESVLARSKGVESTIEILEAILRLRQICCDPRLAGFEAPSPKLSRMIEDLHETVRSGHKVLVISQFAQMLSLIKPLIEVPYVYLDGGTKDRESVVSTFQEDPGTPVMLMSLKAGGVGLNLTAADYVFLYDPWWNEAVERQAIDRAHRLGRQKCVVAKRYVMNLSVEEKIMTLKEHKNSLCAQIMDLESQVHQLSKNDLLELLRP